VQDLHIVGHGRAFDCKTIHTNPEILVVYHEEDAPEAGFLQSHLAAPLCLFTEMEEWHLFETKQLC